MSVLAYYGKAINRAPWAFIAALIAITMVMGYFAQDFEQSSEEDSFSPDNEVSRANNRVQEGYGNSSEQISVLLESENVLSRESLNAQLDLEERISDSDVAEIIKPRPENPSGIQHPAKVVIQSLFYSAALEAAPEQGVQTNGTPDCVEEKNLINVFLNRLHSLSIEEQRRVINGGEISMDLPCVPAPVVLEFEEYTPEVLTDVLNRAPMSIALDFLLSKDYSGGVPEAEKGLFIIYIRENLDPEQALSYEENVESLSEDTEDDYEGMEFTAVGEELTNKKINEASGSSMGILGSLALLMVVLILIFVYRNLLEIVVNVLGLFMAIIWVFGLGGLLGFDFNPSITTVPVLVLGLGIDYGIHLTLRYREEIRKGKSVKDALLSSETSVGFAIFLATITTLLGFLSNVTANSPGIRVFGILTAFGIFSAFTIMITLNPAVKAIWDVRKERKGKPVVKSRKKRSVWGWAAKRAKKLGLTDEDMVEPEGPGTVNRIMSSGASLALHPVPVLAVVLLLTGAGVYGASQLEVRFDFRDFLPDGLEITEATKSVVSDFNFSSEEGYVLIEGGVDSPQVLITMDDVQERARELDTVVSSEPIRSPLELGRSMSDPSSAGYNGSFASVWHGNVDRDFDSVIDGTISAENVSAVYSAMFEYNEEEASRVLKREGSEFTGAVIRIPVNSRGGLRADDITDDIFYAADPMEDLEGQTVEKVTPTGGPLVSQAVLDAISTSQIESVLITFLLSIVLLTGVFLYTRRSLLIGVVTIIPLVFVIAWTLGSMYFLGIPLNVVTVTISAITVGLGIDYAVHITSRFMEDLNRIDDGICALSVAVSHTGTALLGSAFTTVIGFAILSLAIIPPLAQFGQVTALSITFAFLASVFVLPTLLLLWLKGNRWYRSKIKGEDLSELTGECKPEDLS